MLKSFFSILFFLMCFFAWGNNIEKDDFETGDNWMQSSLTFEQEVAIWQKSYPNVQFESLWDKDACDWKITVKNYGKAQDFYWCNGKYLPFDEVANKDKYWRVITKYSGKVLDPKDFSQEQIEKIKSFGENRKNGMSSPKFIFTAIYDASTRNSTEQHIKRAVFLNKTINVHEYLIPILKQVEKKIFQRAKSNANVQKFLDELYSTESYNWREIRNANSRSFHSYGIAVDILPKMWGKKIIYWGFEKNNGNKNWMLIPLEKRWSPPKEVIKIFKDAGFIWGGTWAIWDNMHFEYHPEQLQIQF